MLKARPTPAELVDRLRLLDVRWADGLYPLKAQCHAEAPLSEHLPFARPTPARQRPIVCSLYSLDMLKVPCSG